MGIFSKIKKTEKEEKQLPAPPKFPEMEEVKKAIMPSPEQGSFNLSLPPLSLLPPLSPLPPLSIMPSTAARERQEEKSYYPAPIQMSMPSMEEIPARRMKFTDENDSFKKKAKEPIYVKIEHFKAALSNFEEIKQKLQESFELLEKIKETRNEEKAKLDEWEKEIENIKEKIAELDIKLFSKVSE